MRQTEHINPIFFNPLLQKSPEVTFRADESSAKEYVLPTLKPFYIESTLEITGM